MSVGQFTLNTKTVWYGIPMLSILLLISGVPSDIRAVSDSNAVSSPGLPLNPETRLSSAQAAPCTTAQRMYEEMSVDSTVPDSIRKAAAGYRADIAFALREYETAIDYYKRASRFEKEPGRFHYRLGLAAMANGDTAEAEGIFTPVADRGGIEYCHEAEVMLGEFALRRDEFREAMAFFQKAVPVSSGNSWSIPALLGKLACARHLGLADSAAAYDKQLSAYAPSILEKERLRKIREIPIAKPANAAAASGKQIQTGGRDTAVKTAAAAEAARDSAFSLQVGAFGSKERAQALAKKLAKKFKEVTCVSAIVDERTFFRVWVGNFESREEAESFGKGKLMRQGLVYRVVVK